ncbi:MAG TPA: hypothetical protein VHO25_12875, partial [Polyangiaceae bacterium]|nr:hypothetical protein [Polyangiaceae bacterium]
TAGPIKSENGGNGGNCVAGDATSWERFYVETTTCGGGPVCGDGTCNGTETCTSCAADCGACASCGDGTCNGTETCTSCAADCGTCGSGSCFKIRSQRTNQYLVLDGTNQVVPTGSQAQGHVFEKIASGPGFKFKGSTGSYMRVVANNLTVDTTDPNATVFNEQDCSGAGTYPGGMGYSSATGAAPYWKATTAAGPIQSGDAGNGAACNPADGGSWERFYMEAATCGGSPSCGDGACNGTETCSTCAADCGACSTCGNGACGSGESCSNCPADCGACASCGDGACTGTETCSTCASDCGSCGGGTTRYEAEASTYINATLAAEAGSSGGQYVDGNAGANLTWTVSASAGTATLDFAIRSPSGVRSMGVYVNGSKVGSVNTTTLRPTWAEQGVSATLVAGNNTIELRDSENTAEPDFDYLDITAAGGGPICGDGACNGTETCSSCAADCGACATCGNGVCGGGETCSTCQADCGPCSSTPVKLTLTHLSNSGGWTSVPGLTDGDLVAKHSSGTSPNCVDYNLSGTYTVTSARLMEDNAGAWHTDTWKVQYNTGGGFVDAIAYTDTPNAMPTWNTLDFTDVAGVTSVRVCVQNVGAPVELAEIEVWGFNAPPAVCGDRTCTGSETCASCPWDCNTCTGGQLGLDSRPSNTACVAGSSAAPPPALLSDSPCVMSVSNPPVFTAGVIPYSIAEPFW